MSDLNGALDTLRGLVAALLKEGLVAEAVAALRRFADRVEADPTLTREDVVSDFTELRAALERARGLL